MPLIVSTALDTSFASVGQMQAKGGNITGASSPSGVAGAIEIVGGVARITVSESDVDTLGDKRSEMVFNQDMPAPTGIRWYVWEFMIPSTWNFSTGMAVMQIHETADVGDPSRAVQFVLTLENNQLVAVVPNSILTQATTSKRIVLSDLAFDRWYKVCFKANWQTTATGSWELYLDGVNRLREFNIANAYSDVVGGYLKLGIYNFNSASGWGTKTAYYRNVAVWKDNESYQTVMGTTPRAPLRTVQN